MRKYNSIKNVIVSVLLNVVTIIFGFVVQKIFAINLGVEYLGINGLFSNILSMLAIVELGFGSAIVYNLYKPIAEKDKEKICSLMSFYKTTYRVISIIIVIIGICLLPFIDKIVGKVNVSSNLRFLFFLALLDVVASYLLTYKRSILYADQKNYITNFIHIGYVILLNLCEIIFLYISKNYIVYLIIKILFRLIENIVITIIANKKYPYIKYKKVNKLDSDTKLDIFKKVKGLLFHKIGGAIVLGTDNILISKLFGVIVVGYYSNYHLIINAVSNLLGQVFDSLTASIGNLLIENDSKKSYFIYKTMLLINSWLFSFTGICILCLMEPFIKIWMGEEYILSTSVLIVLVLNYYIQGMKKTNARFKEAAGIFYEDRCVPLAEALINIIASIIFARIFGLVGIFIGTIVSSMVLYLYSYPKFVYKKLFKRSYFQYYIEHLKYLSISMLSAIISFIIVSNISINNLYATLIINLFICIIIPNLIYILIFRKTNELKYIKNMLIEVTLNRFKKKNKI